MAAMASRDDSTTVPRSGGEPVDDEPTSRSARRAAGDTIFIDAHEDHLRWRAAIKSNPTTRRLYRVAVGVIGGGIVLLGIVLLPAPGPGWAIIFVGLAVLASEFDRAKQLLDFAKRHVHRWTSWIQRQHLAVRALVGLAVLALVLGIFWAYFAIAGVPSLMPDVVQNLMVRHVPGLG